MNMTTNKENKKYAMRVAFPYSLFSIPYSLPPHP